MLGMPSSFIWVATIVAVILVLLLVKVKRKPVAANTEQLAMTVWAAFSPCRSAEDAEELLGRSVRAVFGADNYDKHVEWIRGHGANFRLWERQGTFEKSQEFMRRNLLVFAFGTDFEQACQRLRNEAQKLALEALDRINQDILGPTGHRLDAVPEPDGTLSFSYDQIRENQASLAAKIAATVGNNLLTASSDAAIRMKEFLLSQDRESLGMTLEEAGDIGSMWLRLWDLAQDHPESGLAKTFTALNDALEASSGVENGPIEP